jgi:hypothetical protein
MSVKRKVHRAATDVSPKVTVPALVLLVAAIVQVVVTSGWNAPETATAISALVTAVLGYFTADRVAV